MFLTSGFLTPLAQLLIKILRDLETPPIVGMAHSTRDDGAEGSENISDYYPTFSGSANHEMEARPRQPSLQRSVSKELLDVLQNGLLRPIATGALRDLKRPLVKIDSIQVQLVNAVILLVRPACLT